MTQTLIRSNLPIYYQCLCAPTKWARATKDFTNLSALARLLKDQPESLQPELDEDFLRVRMERGLATSFDPWEKRNEFFRLKPGDTEALLRFLPTIGLFEAAGLDTDGDEDHALIRAGDDQPLYKTRYATKTSEKRIWGMQRLLIGSLKNLEKHTGTHRDFPVRIIHAKSGPRVILTTTTFLEAILLTLAVDKVEDAKVTKCARPDCGVPFSSTGGHKRKYCSWYCGHIESVRKARRKTQRSSKKQGSRTSASKKGK